MLVRHLPAEFASVKLYVTPDSALHFWRRRLGAEEAMLLRWAHEFVAPGDVVWDIGANVGVFAFGAAARAGPTGRVLAIEPDPFLASLLRRTAAERLPSVACVGVMEAAACDRMGPISFHVAARGRASNHIDGAGQTTSGGSRQVRDIVGVTLDSLRGEHPPPTLVKIDVEGAEARVLRGGRELLTVDRPVLLCEVSAVAREAVSRELQQLGFLLFDAELSRSERRPLLQAAWNTLATPPGAE